MPGIDIVPGIDNADDGLFKVLVAIARGVHETDIIGFRIGIDESHNWFLLVVRD